MNLTPPQELELFASISIPPWISDLPNFKVNPAVFLNQYRNKWAFTVDQLRQYLAHNPELIESYLQFCHSLIGTHDKVMIAHEGKEYVVFDQDHGRRIGIERFNDKVEAAISWLNYRYMN